MPIVPKEETETPTVLLCHLGQQSLQYNLGDIIQRPLDNKDVKSIRNNINIWGIKIIKILTSTCI